MVSLISTARRNTVVLTEDRSMFIM
jgi:hypothetical protein